MPLDHYVGLTGVQTPVEASAAVDIFHTYGFQPGNRHNNMVGVLVSPSTINNLPPVHSNKPWRQIADFRTLVQTLIPVEGNGVGAVHMELHKDWPGTPGDAQHAIDLLSALKKEGLNPAIQLNGVLTPDDVRRIHGETGTQIILQLRKQITARGEVGVAEYVRSIGGSIAKILMDGSAGTGEPFQVADAVAWQHLLQNEVPADVHYGYAGGLGGHNTRQTVLGLRTALGSDAFSIDTETLARTQSKNPRRTHEDVLDVRLGGAFEQYVGAAADGYGE